MILKEERLKEEFWGLTAKCKYLLCKVDYLSQKYCGKPIVVTTMFYEGGSGVHAAGRAFDIRTENYYDKEEISWFEDHISMNFPYDPGRPKKKTAIYHKAKITIVENGKKKKAREWHLHFQVWVT